VILLARALVRLVSFLLLVILAAAGIAVAVFCIDAGTKGPSLGRLAALLHLASLRDTVGHWLGQLEAGGPVAVLAALCGLGAVLVGLLLLAGLLVPRGERLITMTSDGHGDLAARRRPLAQIAQALAEQAKGVTDVRAKARPRRRTGGRLRMQISRVRPADPGRVSREVSDRLGELTEPFKLKARIDVTRRGARVE
jgi:hypothetical protein